MKEIKLLIALALLSVGVQAQKTFTFEGKQMEAVHVTTAIEKIKGKKALRIERDLQQLPFDAQRIGETTDEPTFVKLVGEELDNGTIEVTVLSRLQDPLLMKDARGFIGVAYHIHPDNSAFESIYIRPTNGRVYNQFRRNHSVQYFAYPDYKWGKLRGSEYHGIYETYADMGLDEWIKLRIEINDGKPSLYINEAKYPSFVVKDTLGNTPSGGIGLWVDIGTIGYFRDIKITKK
jgi:hypothetical protein